MLDLDEVTMVNQEAARYLMIYHSDGVELSCAALLAEVSNRAKAPISEVLRGNEGGFHAFVYAGWSDRVRRIQNRMAPGSKVDQVIHSEDANRLEYVRRYQGVNRLDLHLYDLLVKSTNRLTDGAADPSGHGDCSMKTYRRHR